MNGPKRYLVFVSTAAMLAGVGVAAADEPAGLQGLTNEQTRELMQDQTRSRNRVNENLQQQLRGQGDHAATQQRNRNMEQNRQRRQERASGGMYDRGTGFGAVERRGGGGFAGGGRGAGRR